MALTKQEHLTCGNENWLQIQMFLSKLTGEHRLRREGGTHFVKNKQEMQDRWICPVK